MKIENGTLILNNTDIDHIMGRSPSWCPSETFKDGLEEERYLHGLENTPYDRIELKLRKDNPELLKIE